MRGEFYFILFLFQMNPFVLAAVIVTGIAFLLELLCIALPFWLYAKYTSKDETDITKVVQVHYYVGLFSLCPSFNNDYHACQTFYGE